MSFFLILFLPILLLIIPITLQVEFGRRILNQKKILKYFIISTSFIILEVFMTILGLVISLKGQQMKGLSGLSPGVIGFGFFGIIILVVVILVQITSNRSMAKK
ncbi:MAG: hypothetical protein FD170_3076 [Bacteroidetes bacterium]|nr:MAG: hypothetical protein FD170_3076 [Bacteroidota bacterium]